MRLTCAVLATFIAWLAPPPQPRAPFVPIGVGYEGGPSAPQDFAAMKSLGLNTVVLGAGMSRVDELLALARAGGLHAIVGQDAAPPFLPLPAEATSADVRLRAWEAIARGERAVYFPRWRASRAAAGLLEEDGRIGPRARTAGEFAGIVSRNASLFDPLRPRTGTAAIVRVDGDPTGVGARVLESAAALLIIATNSGDLPRKVTLRFPPDIPEAIWQNLETGAAFSFVMEKDGPSLEHAFLARDVLVLVRAKRLR
jgi:hypothetical protein